MNRFTIIGIVLLFLSTLFFGLHWNGQKEELSPIERSEKINLALRQTSHHLLKSVDDETSLIPPIQKENDNTYSVKMEGSLNYDTLPHLLDQSLYDYNIEDTYRVSISDCDSGFIILGYNESAYRSSQLPCRGREQDSKCTYVKVSFEQTTKASIPFLPIGAISAFGAFALFFLARKEQDKNSHDPDSEEEAIATETHIYSIGQSTFDPKSMTYAYNGNQKSLTYRESKLLEYLVNHKNQVLKRQDIQDHVWNEEGVIVGRSLDVFISRLRKILKDNEGVLIKNIHGVGYKLLDEQ